MPLALPDGVADRRVLLVEADVPGREELRVALEDHGLEAACASSVDEALSTIPGFAPGALLVSAELPGVRELPARLERLGSDATVLVLATRERLADAVGALRAGAEDLLLRPVDVEPALLALDRGLDLRRLRRERSSLREQARTRAAIVGSTPAMRAVRELVERAGPTRTPVSIVGEPGSGRAHLAQALHEASPEHQGPFVRVRCAGPSEPLLASALFGWEAGDLSGPESCRAGAIELAIGGTLYLEEVSGLSPALQHRLLEALRRGSVERGPGGAPVSLDVRIIASSRQALSELAETGGFLVELSSRLSAVCAMLPPLRARRDDLAALVAHFVARASRARGRDVRGMAPGALAAVFAHRWPGNLRELADAVDRAVAAARSRDIELADLPPVVRCARSEAEHSPFPAAGATMEEIEREAILRALDQCGGSTVRAAGLLGVSVRKVQYRLKEYRAGGSIRRGSAMTAARG